MIIRKLREQIGLNQSQLAKLSGLDQTTISKIESGQRRKVHADTLGAIAKALKTSVEVLQGGKEFVDDYSQADVQILQYLKEHLSNDQLTTVANLTRTLNDDELAQLITRYAQTHPESRKAILTLLGDKHG